jgi:hypothetical protein
MGQKEEETQERICNNDPPTTKANYSVVRNNGLHQRSNVVVQYITLDEG